jgi:hypothetical protein
MRSLALALAVVALGAAKTAVIDPDVGCGPQLDPSSGGVCQPVTVAAYGGWAAWSRADPKTGDFELVLRDPAGQISTPAVGERDSPFDVSLGPSGRGVVAVYSRCADTITLQGCSIYELTLPSRSERTVPIPGGGSLHEPAIWDGRIAFLRRNPGGGDEDPAISGPRPDDLYEWRIGSPATTPLPFPASFGHPGAVIGLALHGDTVYFANSPHYIVALEGLWSQSPGRAPHLIDSISAGQGGLCPSWFLSPVIAGGWLYAFHLDCSQNGERRWQRYSLTTSATEAATTGFGNVTDGGLVSVIPFGRGVLWIDDGVLRDRSSVAWRSVGRPGEPAGCHETHC